MQEMVTHIQVLIAEDSAANVNIIDETNIIYQRANVRETFQFIIVNLSMLLISTVCFIMKWAQV